MLKISLHHLFPYLYVDYKYIQLRKDPNYTTDRRITSAIKGWLSQWQEPCIPYALPCNSLEIRRSQGMYRNDTYICELMDQTIQDRRNFWTGNSPGLWLQADYGLFGQESCPQNHRAGQAKREESQRCFPTFEYCRNSVVDT